MNNKNNIYNKIISTHNNNTYYYLKKYILSIINNKYYTSILYIMCDKGFTYDKEIRDLLGVNGTAYFSKLILNNVIVSYDLTSKEKDFIIKIKGNMNNNTISRMNFYTITKEAKEILTCDFLNDIFMDTVLKPAKELKDNQLKKFNEVIEIHRKRQDMEERMFRAKCKRQGIILESSNKDIYTTRYEDILQ